MIEAILAKRRILSHCCPPCLSPAYLRFVTILDPGLSTGEPAGSYPPFESGEELGVWVQGADGSPVQGDVWPEAPVYYVDYTSPGARDWWREQIVRFHKVLPWDGLWIDMNEPASQVRHYWLNH